MKLQGITESVKHKGKEIEVLVQHRLIASVVVDTAQVPEQAALEAGLKISLTRQIHEELYGTLRIEVNKALEAAQAIPTPSGGLVPLPVTRQALRVKAELAKTLQGILTMLEA